MFPDGACNHWVAINTCHREAPRFEDLHIGATSTTHIHKAWWMPQARCFGQKEMDQTCCQNRVVVCVGPQATNHEVPLKQCMCVNLTCVNRAVCAMPSTVLPTHLRKSQAQKQSERNLCHPARSRLDEFENIHASAACTCCLSRIHNGQCFWNTTDPLHRAEQAKMIKKLVRLHAHRLYERSQYSIHRNFWSSQCLGSGWVWIAEMRFFLVVHMSSKTKWQ